ncbi:MAG: hypothetical protein HY815_32160 [Candidatus Riflebacteria bacterium]|nr:hypothetical protein [Candidatus Riflebacteria bacterium]
MQQQGDRATTDPAAPRAAVPLAWSVASLAFCSLYLWLAVRPELFYPDVGGVPFFQWGTTFFSDSVAIPGGLAGYAAALVSQTLRSGLLGALAVAANLQLLGSLAGACWRLLTHRPGTWVAPAITVLGMMPFVRYGNFLPAVEALIAASGVALLGARFAPRAVGPRAALYAAAVIGLYQAAGVVSLAFVALCIGLEAGHGSGGPGGAGEADAPRRVDRLRLLPIAAAVAAALAAPLAVGVWWAELTLPEALSCGAPWSPDRPDSGAGWAVALVVAFPAGVALALLGLPGLACRLGAGWTARVRPALARGMLAVAIAATPFFSHNRDARDALCVLESGRRGDWRQVLHLASRMAPAGYPLGVVATVNKALLAEGTLLDDMFGWPQPPGTPPELLFQAGFGERLRASSRGARLAIFLATPSLSLELGLANEAEHEAYEAWGTFGPQVPVLRQLALVNLVKGRPAAASVFLRDLARCPGEQAEARAVLERIARDPGLTGWPYIRRIRSRLRRTEEDPNRQGFRTSMEALVAVDPANVAAADLLVAEALLTRDLDRVAAALPRLGAAGRRRLPRHCHEALLIREAHLGKKPDLGGWEVDAGTASRFRTFTSASTAALNAGGPGAVAELAARDYPDTYYRYYLFTAAGPRR